jgi:hypothetical protein
MNGWRDIKMNIYLALIIIFSTIAVFLPLTIISLSISKNLNNIVEIEANKVKNEQNRIYMDIDTRRAKEVIDETIKEYINKWILVNITSKSGNYIKDSEVDELINYVTSTIILEMSDVHLFYIKCIANISDDDSLIIFVRNEVKFLVLEVLNEFNKME